MHIYTYIFLNNNCFLFIVYTFWYEYFKSTNLGPEATKDFDKFFGFTKKYFCQTAQDTPWPCCQNTQDPGCRTPPEHAMEVVKLFANPSDGLQIAFLYHWCTQVSFQWYNFHSNGARLTASASFSGSLEWYRLTGCHFFFRSESVQLL